MSVLDPQRPCTPYQRRRIISQMVADMGVDIVEAAKAFEKMEVENLEELKKLAAKYPVSPKGES